MRTVNVKAREAKKIEIMEKVFDCYAESGLNNISMKDIADKSGFNVASVYQYFNDLDDLIIQSTGYCMAKAPNNVEDLWKFIDEVPYWTAKEHGKKYCLMYQVYTSPKYKKYGQEFFKGVDQRYTEYAKSLESKLGIPYEKITPLIFILIRASVHYALFEDEFYLKSQLSILKEALILFIDKYKGVNTK